MEKSSSNSEGLGDRGQLDLSRRNLTAGLLGIASFNFVSKTAVDTNIHGWNYGNPSARSDEAYKPAIQNFDNGKLDLNIVNLCLEPENAVNSDEELKIVDDRLSQLREGLDVDTDSYNLDLPRKYEKLIKETTVKASRDLTSDIENYLINKGLLEETEDGLTIYIGDFDTENGDYIGTGHQDSNTGAVADKYGNMPHKLNQVLHNTGHKLGLPHTLTEDVMSWSPYKKITSFHKVHGFGIESKKNMEKIIEHYLEN